MLYPATGGFFAPLIAVSGAVQVRTTPSRRATAARFAGATGTSSGTIVARFERSPFAVVPSVTTAYVTRVGRPSVVWNGGASSYVSRAPVVAAGKLAPSMLSTRLRSFRNWAGASVGIFEKSWMACGFVGSVSPGSSVFRSRGGCDTGSSSVARQTTTRRIPVIDFPAVVIDG